MKYKLLLLADNYMGFCYKLESFDGIIVPYFCTIDSPLKSIRNKPLLFSLLEARLYLYNAKLKSMTSHFLYQSVKNRKFNIIPEFENER